METIEITWQVAGGVNAHRTILYVEDFEDLTNVEDIEDRIIEAVADDFKQNIWFDLDDAADRVKEAVGGDE